MKGICNVFVIIHPRKGTETFNLMMDYAVEYEVIIHPRKGTETYSRMLGCASAASYNSPPQGDGNPREVR